MKCEEAFAEECIVLLENDGILPLQKPGYLALFGNGARRTIKGGSGSGDVNTDIIVSIEEGLLQKGFQIETSEWLKRMDQKLDEEETAYRRKLEQISKEQNIPLVSAFLSNPKKEVPPVSITENDLSGKRADTAVYVISRSSGEGSDRLCERGDYLPFCEELDQLKLLTNAYKNVILILNIGGVMELREIKEIEGINAIVLMSQLGSYGGTALAKILLGEAVPSGKLSDTWARVYEDYPSSQNFGQNNGNLNDEYYDEGIFVGYRHFDTKRIEPEYCFGFGKSYTDFSIQVTEIHQNQADVRIQFSVKNIGIRYSGKEVVQVYVSAPVVNLEKPTQALAAFYKTKMLEPGEIEEVSLTIPYMDISSYSEEQEAWLLEPGEYIFCIGNSSRNTRIAGGIQIESERILKREKRLFAEKGAVKTSNSGRGVLFDNQKSPVTMEDIRNGKATLEDLTSQLSIEEMAAICVGAFRVENSDNSVIGSSSERVAGAAGETSAILERTRGILPIVMADGPAGLRLQAKCTALPIGWAIAHSWNTSLAEDAGDLVGKEMEKNEIDLWLAPALNIHRNPLCGRNFEYYSEDPYLSGKMAAAVTKGVQKHPGKGVTVKHFAVNNQEENRYFVNAHIGERELREIYLKGFEIAIKESDPAALMTSYNLINGVHAANSYELLQTLLREEWNYPGLVMTDWYTSQDVPEITGKYESSYPISSSVGCIFAGNDLQMPGCKRNAEDIIRAVKSGEEIDGYKIAYADLQQAALHVLRCTLRLKENDKIL